MKYDCCIFFDELDCLEIRLNELKDAVDKFVIVEGDSSFQGTPKPWNLENNWGRFREFKDKIIYLKYHIPNRVTNIWQKEIMQRNYIMEGLKGCKDTDIVFCSDVDEIPKKEIFDLYQLNMGPALLEMQMSYFYFNYVMNECWYRAIIMPYIDLRDVYPNSCREIHSARLCIKNAGWHFSYLGGPDAIINKLKSFSHPEYNKFPFNDKQHILDSISKCEDLFGRKDMTYSIVPLDNNFPQYILENEDRFKHLIMQPHENMLCV